MLFFLLYPSKMDQIVQFPSAEKYNGITAFVEASESLPISTFQRLFLTGGGTLTSALHTLLTVPVHVGVIRQELHEADFGLVQFLELKEPEKGLQREIWILGKNGEKLVYAKSFLPLQGLNPSLHDALVSQMYSLGELIEKMKIASIKDKLGFGTINSHALSEAFQLSHTGPLWYRHFRLTSPQQLLASIYEVFSPRLFVQ
jgi:chorismate-pyruvate lyase